MDEIQKDHLKAYGVAFWVFKEDLNFEWFLNYRGGAFMLDSFQKIEPSATYNKTKVHFGP